MKRDMDLVRNILLYIEELPPGKDSRRIPDKFTKGLDKDVVCEHVKLLIEAGLLDGKIIPTMSGCEFMVFGLTWNGHEFIENAREPNNWEKIKTIAKKLGSHSFGILGEIAKTVVGEEFKKMLGGP